LSCAARRSRHAQVAEGVFGVRLHSSGKGIHAPGSVPTGSWQKVPVGQLPAPHAKPPGPADPSPAAASGAHSEGIRGQSHRAARQTGKTALPQGSVPHVTEESSGPHSTAGAASVAASSSPGFSSETTLPPQAAVPSAKTSAQPAIARATGLVAGHSVRVITAPAVRRRWFTEGCMTSARRAASVRLWAQIASTPRSVGTFADENASVRLRRERDQSMEKRGMLTRFGPSPVCARG